MGRVKGGKINYNFDKLLPLDDKGTDAIGSGHLLND